MPGSIEIIEITTEQTWPIRHQVMWPEKSFTFVQLPEDATGVHFGAFLDGELASVISLFLQGNQAQFRKFATLTSLQGKGLGKQLLEHVFVFAAKQGIALVWCHARTTAYNFYLKAGMHMEGAVFKKNGKDYVRMEKDLL
jgi:GNAT superfamily N-acetyltransferase